MDLDELQSVQSRERQTDSLQQLRESFYAEASEFVQKLREARDDAAERADDPWDSPEVSQLTDEINTAEQTLEAIYDRRTGKIVKKASLAAAGMPTEDEGLTTEERALFESLVAQIEDNREHVLDKIAGEVAPDSIPDVSVDAATASETTESAPETPSPGGREDSPDPDAPEPPEPPADVSAADLMGEGDSQPEEPPVPPAEDDPEAPETPPPADGRPASADDPSAETTQPASPRGDDAPEADEGGQPDEADEIDDTESVSRTTVRITDDVGAIYGVDDREYDLSRNDVVTLPEENAGPLLQNGAAEQFD